MVMESKDKMKPDNLLRLLGMQYNLLQAYRAIFITTLTFLLAFSLDFFITGVSEFIDAYILFLDKSVKNTTLFFHYLKAMSQFSFCAGLSLFSLIILFQWINIANTRGFIVWYSQIMVRAYEEGIYEPKDAYTKLMLFQKEIRNYYEDRKAFKIIPRCRNNEDFEKIFIEYSKRTYQETHDQFEAIMRDVIESEMRKTISRVRYFYLWLTLGLLLLSVSSSLCLILYLN